MSLNFSKPTPIKSSQKKVNPISAGLEKIWAFTGMISLMVPGATTKDNISAKNIGVLIFIILVTYMGICGLWMNIQWLLSINITGEWFYYTGIAVTAFTCIEFFNIEKKVREFALEKKLIFPNRDSLLEKVIGRSKLYNIFSLLMEATGFLWVVLGIIFYDRPLFISLLVISALFTVLATHGCKKTDTSRNVFMIESIFSIALLLFILLNHFLIS